MSLGIAAAENSPRPHPWFPDWRGQPAAIIASGPSAKSVNIGLLKGRFRILAIKENIDLCPFADAVYGCDAPWWKHRKGLPDFKGLKLTYSADICKRFPDIRKVEVKSTTDKLLLDHPGTIGSGGNSGYQGLNLVEQFGATQILLIGFDMHGKHGAHWYGRNRWPSANNPTDDNFRRWVKAFMLAADDLETRGVEVINASPTSVLTGFRKLSVEQAIDAWGL